MRCRRQHRRGKHAGLIVGKARGVRILLCVRGRDGLVEGGPHGDVVRQVGGQPSIEVGRAGLEMGGETTILIWQVVVFLLVHLLVDDVLLRDPQRSTGTTLVDLRRSTSGLDPSLEAAVAPA